VRLPSPQPEPRRLRPQAAADVEKAKPIVAAIAYASYGLDDGLLGAAEVEEGLTLIEERELLYSVVDVGLYFRHLSRP
jgi:hypothetical protein